MTTTTQPKRKCIDGGTCHHECQPSECFREECCAPFSDSGLDDNWKPIAALPLPAMPEQAEPVAYLATDFDGKGELGFTKEDAHKNAGEDCNDYISLFSQDPAALLARIAELEAENQKLKEDNAK